MNKFIFSLLISFVFLGAAQAAELYSDNNAELYSDNNLEKQLVEAAKNGKIELVRKLLEKGVDINTPNESANPLIWCAYNNDVEMTGVLINKNAKLNRKDQSNGQTPLMYAARRGHNEVLKLLLENKADIDAQVTLQNVWGGEETHTALRLAASNQHISTIELLLKDKADIINKDFFKFYGEEVLKIINEYTDVFLGAAQAAELYSDNNAELYSDNNLEKQLVEAAKNGKIELVRKLLEKGVDINTPNESANPLIWCAYNNDVEMTGVLINKNAKLNRKDQSNGQTPLMYAARRGHNEVLKLLLENKADIDAQVTLQNVWGGEETHTALRLAASNQHISTIELLLKDKADIVNKDFFKFYGEEVLKIINEYTED